MSLIEQELGDALYGAVKRKANATGKLRATAGRVAKGSPEVMVKITGFGKGGAHVKSHLEYVTRNGDVELENDRGEVFRGREEVKELFDDWNADFSDGKRHKNQRDTMHLVLSMPESTEPEAVRAAVREFARDTFGRNYEYVFALHTDEPHPHCHVTVKCLGYDGRRLNPRKSDLQDWRESFAQAMRDQGEDAEATPRSARGVTRRGERSVLRHMQRGDKTHPPRVPRVIAARTKEVANELIAESSGSTPASHLWDAAISARRMKVRNAWLEAASILERKSNVEKTNVRPDYGRLDTECVRRGHRAAALYQSDLARIGSREPPRSVTRMRDVPSRDLVQHKDRSQVLLHADARNRVGRVDAPGDDVRRARTGLAVSGGAGRPPGGLKRLADVITHTADNRELAGDIRAFVASMPPTETVRDRLKTALRARFGGASRDAAGQGVVEQPADVSKGHGPSAATR